MTRKIFYLTFGLFSLLIGLSLGGWLVYNLIFLSDSELRFAHWRGLLGMSLCMTFMGIFWLRIGAGKLKRSAADKILK